MRVKEIGQINEALLVLKHFIDLSARLLPFLHDLQRNPNPDNIQRLNKVKIMDVYENYEFDTETSKILLNSNILDLIKDAYNAMRQSSNSRELRRSARELNKFLMEHKRLQNDWYFIDAN